MQNQKELLEKRTKKSDRLLIKLIIVAAIMAGTFELGEWLQKKGILPFGFRYQIIEKGLGARGSLNKIQKPGLEKILSGIPFPRRITFFSEIYAAKPGRIFFHVTRPESVSLTLDGSTIQLAGKKFFIPLVLKKGFSPIVIRYTLPAENPADLHIAFSENATLLPFPFFRLVWPGETFSIPKIVFFLIRIIDIGRTLFFPLVLLLIFLRLPRLFFRQHDPATCSSISLFQLILQLFINIFSVFNVSVFTFYIMKVHIPLSVFFCGSILLSLFILFLTCKKRTLTFNFNWKKAGVFFGISLIVLLYVFVTCGSFLPLEPIGYGDFNNHLQMIKSIETQGRFMQEKHRRIYPQSIHATIVSGAKNLGLPPEEYLTPFLMAMLVLLFFSIYLLGNELFPGIPLYLWGVSLGISNAVFIFQVMFRHYQFPPVIAISLFFFSLFFYLRRFRMSASLSLAAGLVIYPYYAPAFLSGIIIFSCWLEFPFHLRKWLRLAAFLLPSLALMGIYTVIYLMYGFVQQKEGFEAASLLNPFLSLRFWNTSLIFVAVVFSFSLKKAKPVLGLFSAISCGILLNYIPYALFNTQSTYYIMKNMLLLIAAGLIFAAAALFFIFQKIQHKKWLFPCILFMLLAVSIGTYYHSAATTSPRIGRGATAVNRWLLKHTPRGDAILMNVRKQFGFFSQTLGAQRKLIRVVDDSSFFTSEASWLVINNSLAAAIAQNKNLEKSAELNDFSIFRLKKPDRTNSGNK